MAHEIDMSKGFAAMAYVGDQPWHGLGQQMQPGQSIEEWQRAAGMDFELLEAPVLFQAPMLNKVNDRKVIYRSDTHDALAVVGNDYQVVQPTEVLEFYRNLTATAGFDLETAGVLRGGRKYWALANMQQEARVLDDDIRGYLLLGTSCDGSMATTAMFTSIRVVCNNTLGFAMENAKNQSNTVKIYHRSKFVAEDVQAQLGIAATSWQQFLKHVDVWAKTKINHDQAKSFFDQMASYTKADGTVAISPRVSEMLMNLWLGDGIGMDREAANETAWGAINAVTEFVDHHRGRSSDVRMDRAWFGDGVTLKQKATDLANAMLLAA